MINLGYLLGLAGILVALALAYWIIAAVLEGVGD